MKRINIYEDGKLSRAVKANLIKTQGDKVLISFESDWDDKPGIQKVWFHMEDDIFTCYDPRDHWNTNYWYYPNRETKKFALKMKEYMVAEYFDEYFKHLIQ